MQNKQFILLIHGVEFENPFQIKALKPIVKTSLLFLYLLGLPLVTYAQIKPIKPFGKIRAIVVGVSDYQHEKISDLQYAHRDAEAFATFLTQETAWKAAPEDVVLLTNESATYAKFINELKAIADKSAPKDRLIIYFSGHGDIEQVSNEQMGYLLFYDASPTTYASGGACMVNTLDKELNRLVLAKETEVLLITDACRSGSLAGSRYGGPRATTAALAELFTNTVRILSCQPDQFSVEGPNWGGGRGLFSYHLINGLRGLADENQNRYVNKFELERYVQDQVRAENNSQLPFANGPDNKRITRVDPKILQLNTPAIEAPMVKVRAPLSTTTQDTNWQPYLARFKDALIKEQLLFPKEGSAYAIYQSIGNSSSAQAIKELMKIDLASALQNEAQQALNDYISTPASELNRRWRNNEVYAYYPEYLKTAAELLGDDSYFYEDIKSREHYFRGVNLRLASLRAENRDSVLQLALIEQEKALALQTVAPHIYNEMGILYRRLKREPERLAAFQKANALSPRWGLALSNLARTMKDQQRFNIAEKMYQDAIELDPSLPLSYYNLAILYKNLERYPEAIEMYNQVIEKDVDKEITEVYYNLANIFSEADSTLELAIENAQTYIGFEPEDPDGYTLLGYLYKINGQTDKAIEVFSEALKYDEEDLFALENVAILFFYSDRYRASIPYFNRFLKITEEEKAYFLFLAEAQIRIDDLDGALQTIETLFKSGFKDENQIQINTNLKPIIETDQYKELLKKYFPDRK